MLHLSVKVIPCLLHHSPWATIRKPLVKCAKSWEIGTPIFSWESLLSLYCSSTDTLYFLSKEEIIFFASFCWRFFFYSQGGWNQGNLLKLWKAELANRPMMTKLPHGKRTEPSGVCTFIVPIQFKEKWVAKSLL